MTVADHHKALLAAAKKRGATIVDRGHGHFQIVGKLLVNYYPSAKRQTAYIAGTRHGKQFVNPEQAVALAFKPPEYRPGEAERKNYRRTKIRLFKRQKKCHWCNEKLTIQTATVDHVIPLSRGGLDNDNNRVLACSPCNQKRGHAMPEVRA